MGAHAFILVLKALSVLRPYCRCGLDSRTQQGSKEPSSLCQIAEALAKAKYSHVFEAFSAGTGTKPRINQDAENYERTIYYRYCCYHGMQCELSLSSLQESGGLGPG